MTTDLRDIFFLECEDLLAATEEGLRTLRETGPNPETLNAVFRAVHSIKGGAGAFALNDLVAFAHKLESILDDLRSGRLEAEVSCFELLLSAGDHLADLVTAARRGETLDAATLQNAIDALAMISGVDKSDEKGDGSAIPAFTPLALDLDLGTSGQAGTSRHWSVKFRLHDAALAAGHDAALLLQQLAEVGDLKVELDCAGLAAASEFDPNRSYLGWTVELSADAGRPEIEDIFDFVRGNCDLEISELVEEIPEPQEAPAIATDAEDTGKAPIGEVSTPAPPNGAARTTTASATANLQTIRVEIDRVDRLVDIVGELVIHQAMLTEAIEGTTLRREAEIERALDQLRQLSRQIQEGVMSIRAQPVKPLFDRMHRIVREACAASGKRARLVTEGETTEVDKTIIERLADPLTHMIRNAVDHGLEAPGVRSQKGKASEGVIRLSASHRSGRIHITVSDDGAGIDRERVKRVAAARGLIAANSDLTSAEIDNLLFMPGFSTASSVSNLSGRGVGMDVVKSEITSLGGKISINSIEGSGTTITISLPLTLAVLDGMVVEVAGQLLVLPVNSIIETVRLDQCEIHPLGADARVLNIRGTMVPLLDVANYLGFTSQPTENKEAIVGIVELGDNSALALVFDGIRDQRQVVIKGLETNYGQIRGIAAATILGDGSIALILDPTDLKPQSPSPPRSGVPIAAE